MSILPPFVEGQRAPRVRCSGKAKLSLAERAFNMDCQLVNISRSGLLLNYLGHLGSPLEQGQRIELYLDDIPNITDGAVKCTATVARMSQSCVEDRRVWHIGLQFPSEDLLGPQD